MILKNKETLNKEKMNKFKFKIEEILHLQKSGVTVLHGVLLEGKIMTESLATLMHDIEQNQIMIKGVELIQFKNKSTQSLSLAINSKVNKKALSLMKEGDFLLGN